MDNIELKPGSYDATILKAEGNGMTFDFTFEIRKLGESAALKELNVKMKAFHGSTIPQTRLLYISSDSETNSYNLSFRASLPQQYNLVSDFVKETGLIGLSGELMICESSEE